jgi:superfamily II DNA or RNA helicase
MKIDLRPYQDEAIENLRRLFGEKFIRLILCAPTGAGKSIIMLAMILALVNKGKRCIVLCERRILVEQFSKHLDKAGIDHGVMMAGHWRNRPYAQVQVCSVQTLERIGEWPEVDVIFGDEIHALLRKSVMEMIEKHDTKWVGATATPFHPSLGKYFERIVNVTTMSNLVKDEFLVPFNVFVSKEVDTEGLKVTAGEWKKDDLESRALTIIGDVVSDYVRIKHEVFGERKIKAICFSAGVLHGAELVKKFAEVGVNAIQLSYKDSDEFKQEVIADFSKPDTVIDMLISSDLLTRGFDVPDIEHVVCARPLRKSFSTWVQMIGRGARIYDGKKECVLQCNSGNWLRFEDDWNELYHNGVDKLQDADTKKRVEKSKKEKQDSICPKCHRLWTGGTICPHCGFEKKRRDMSEAVPGTMINLGKEKFTVSAESYWQQCMHMEQTAGWSRGRSKASLKEWFGVWPHDKWSSTPAPPDEHFLKIQAESKRKYIANLRKESWKAKNLGPKLGITPTKSI